MLYIGLVIGTLCGLLLAALFTQSKISDMELEIAVLQKKLKSRSL